MNSIGLEHTEMGIEPGGELRLSDYTLADLWTLWWRVGRALTLSAILTVAVWIARYRQRDELRDLDLSLLQDIGITPEQARKEANKHFWEI